MNAVFHKCYLRNFKYILFQIRLSDISFKTIILVNNFTYCISNIYVYIYKYFLRMCMYYSHGKYF